MYSKQSTFYIQRSQIYCWFFENQLLIIELHSTISNTRIWLLYWQPFINYRIIAEYSDLPVKCSKNLVRKYTDVLQAIISTTSLFYSSYFFKWDKVSTKWECVYLEVLEGRRICCLSVGIEGYKNGLHVALIFMNFANSVHEGRMQFATQCDVQFCCPKQGKSVLFWGPFVVHVTVEISSKMHKRGAEFRIIDGY